MGERVFYLGNVDEVYILGDGRLAQVGPEDGLARLLVRQRDVDQLVQATGTQDGRVDDVRSVGRTWIQKKKSTSTYKELTYKLR